MLVEYSVLSCGKCFNSLYQYPSLTFDFFVSALCSFIRSIPAFRSENLGSLVSSLEHCKDFLGHISFGFLRNTWSMFLSMGFSV